MAELTISSDEVRSAIEDYVSSYSADSTRQEVGIVILGSYETIEEGHQVTRTGRVLSVPVGDNFLGRVVNPLGQPLDGLGDIESEGEREMELQAASVVERQSVSEPLQTGIKAIDAM